MRDESGVRTSTLGAESPPPGAPLKQDRKRILLLVSGLVLLAFAGYSAISSQLVMLDAAAASTAIVTSGGTAAPVAPPPRQAFKGSVVHKTHDVHLLENVCWSSGREAGVLTLFHDDEKILEPFTADHPVARGMRHWITWTRRPKTDWFKVSTRANTTPRDTAVYFFQEQSNPAHCLHDIVFSLFANSTTGPPHFDAYFNSHTPGQACDPRKHWCCFLHSRLKLFPGMKGGNSSSIVVAKGAECFERLYVPAYMHHRFASQWDDPELARLQFTLKRAPHFYIHKPPGGYPLTSLKEIQRRAILNDDEISNKRVSRPSVQDKASQMRNLLVIDRSDAKRRIWNNAGEFISRFLNSYNSSGGNMRDALASVTYYGARWGELTPLEQARAFHHANVVVAPHGGHLSSLIFSQPVRQMKIFELYCDSHPTTKEEQAFERLQSWFGTFPSRLNMSYWLYKPVTSACSHYSRSFNASTFELVKFIRDRIDSDTLDR